METGNLYLIFWKTCLDIPWVPKPNENLKNNSKRDKKFPLSFSFLGSGGQGSLDKETRDLFASRIELRFSFFTYLPTVQVSSSQKRNLACFRGKVLAGKSEFLRQLNFGPILPGGGGLRGEYALLVYCISC